MILSVQVITFMFLMIITVAGLGMSVVGFSEHDGNLKFLGTLIGVLGIVALIGVGILNTAVDNRDTHIRQDNAIICKLQGGKLVSDDTVCIIGKVIKR